MLCCLICRTEIEESNVHKAQILQQIDQYSETIEELRKRCVGHLRLGLSNYDTVMVCKVRNVVSEMSSVCKPNGKIFFA